MPIGFRLPCHDTFIQRIAHIFCTVANVSIGHYTLRWLLYRNGSLPFRDLIPFLDYCVERIFLRRVGGGYIFVHRLLMEHFASLYSEQPPAPSSDGGTQAEIASTGASTT